MTRMKTKTKAAENKSSADKMSITMIKAHVSEYRVMTTVWKIGLVMLLKQRLMAMWI